MIGFLIGLLLGLMIRDIIERFGKDASVETAMKTILKKHHKYKYCCTSCEYHNPWPTSNCNCKNCQKKKLRYSP